MVAASTPDGSAPDSGTGRGPEGRGPERRGLEGRGPDERGPEERVPAGAPAAGADRLPARRANRLAAESSPYLQQHAHNPVDWYPWGPEALERAAAEQRPILLSVGYSACHWCHVMERESFEDEDIAALMNRHFVCIKVDREERPDIDHIYQTICQVVTHSGGWPLTVFLTPDRRPFFVGTYFPPEGRYGRPGLRQLLEAVAAAWEDRRSEVEATAREWADVLQRVDRAGPPAARPPEPEAVAGAARALADRFDRRNGGFGTAPKFPNPDNLELLLRGGPEHRELALLALRRMAAGGIYDQLGGGFHRYSVDAAWRVPHFEKMLYDNALLIPLYLTGYQLSGDALLARVARETADYLLRDMRGPHGGFFATQDADSEGEEGRYYLWTPGEVDEAAGPELGALLRRHFGVTDAGNFEGGRTVLHLAAFRGDAGAPPDDAAAPEDAPAPEDATAPHGVVAPHGAPAPQGATAPHGPATPDVATASEDAAALARGRQALLAARRRRQPPFRDEKVLAGWNGLAIGALARAARVLDEPAYAAAAAEAAEFLLTALRQPDGGLLRRWKDGRAGIPGTLEDYAYLAAGLLELYEATGRDRFLVEAVRLCRQAVQRFWDDREGFFLAEAAPDLVHRPREVADSATPAPGSVAARTLLRLHPFTGDPRFQQIPETLFRLEAQTMERHPWGMASLLTALDLAGQGACEVVILAPTDAPEARDWLRCLAGRYVRDLIVSRVGPDGPDPATVAALTGSPERMPPLWEGRTARGGAATAYVCRGFTCSLPATAWAEIERWL